MDSIHRMRVSTRGDALRRGLEGMMEKRKRAVSIETLAKMYDVSENTIRREIKDGRLKTIPIRGAIRVTMESIEKWERDLVAESKDATHSFTNRHV